MCQHLTKGRISRMPPHPYQPVGFTNGQNLQINEVQRFNYVAPVVKYSPAMFQPGPVYSGGIASAIGHQPWNWSDVWTAYSTPSQMDFAYGHSFKGTQSTASFAIAQQAISNMLALRSINSANVGG
jgi:hypothetical protein